MDKSHKLSSRGQWVWMSIPFILVLLVLALSARAQQSSRGNITVGGGGNATLFGAHSFVSGGGGPQPGVIGTVRTAPFGILSFGPGVTWTGANDANHVDGYVRKFGTGQFVFPTGDNGHFGPFAASADGTTGAYFLANPSTAVTSNLAGGNYGPLPSGAPFSTTSKAVSLTTVSQVEYWDIDGANATPITLTWSAASGIGTLTGNALGKLTIAGWNGTQWVPIPSTVDGTSVLGGTSDLTAGSITTNAAITPDTYTAYTFAAILPDLAPVIYALPATQYGTTNFTVVVDVFEVNSAATSGPITVYLTKDPLVNLSFTPGSVLVGGRLVQNTIWTFDGTSDPSSYIFTTSQSIPAGAKRSFGLTGVLTPGNTQGALTISSTVVGGSGGEVRIDNNSDADKIDYFKK